MKRVIYVQILGQDYPIEASSGDDLYINRLAQFVESKMKEIREETNTVDSYKLAILAAMNIADELFRLQESDDHTSRALENRAEKLVQILDSALREPVGASTGSKH